MEFPKAIVNFLMGMAALIPLSYPLRFMPKAVRFWYSLILGFVLQVWVYETSMYPVYLQHLIVFGLIKFRGPRCGKLVTFQSMVFLSGYHFYDIYTNYGGFSMNAVALLMVLVCKYSLLAYNLEDGAKPFEQLTDEQKGYRITEKISFL
jgi:hypothetical protein